MERRVVVTGIGTVTGFGEGIDALWDGLTSGQSAIAPIQTYEASGFASMLAAQARDFRVRDWVPKGYRKATKVMARDIELAVGAASIAVEHANLVTRAAGDDAQTTYNPTEVGCHIGAGLISAEAPEMAVASVSSTDDQGAFTLAAWGERGLGNLQPLWLLKYLPNMLACHVTIIHGLEGPSNTITCAEASGLLSLGESMRVIQRGDATACFAGGAESKINLTAHARMQTTGRLADADGSTDPLDIVRPFDPDSSGTLLGEAAGILIIEELDSAKARGATIHAELAGFSAAQSVPSESFALRDSNRSEEETGPSPESDTGLVFAIEGALADAGVQAEDIDAIIPHGSGYFPDDRAEAGALKEVFGDALASKPVILWTPALGDCLAGNGGLQAAIGARCIGRGELPPYYYLDSRLERKPEPKPAGSQSFDLRYILVCTNSMGGQNAAIVLRKIK